MFLQLIKVRKNGLGMLERINLKGEPLESQILQVFETLLSKGPPQNIAIREWNLGLGLCSEASSDFYNKAIKDSARICGGSLEVWSDELYFPMEAETLASLFSLFRKLRIIHLRATVMGKGADLDDGIAMELVEVYVGKLALRCDQLEEVRVSNPWGRSFVMRIGRGEGGLMINEVE
jgi:hypothetical protein